MKKRERLSSTRMFYRQLSHLLYFEMFFPTLVSHWPLRLPSKSELLASTSPDTNEPLYMCFYCSQSRTLLFISHQHYTCSLPIFMYLSFRYYMIYSQRNLEVSKLTDSFNIVWTLSNALHVSLRLSRSLPLQSISCRYASAETFNAYRIIALSLPSPHTSGALPYQEVTVSHSPQTSSVTQYSVLQTVLFNLTKHRKPLLSFSNWKAQKYFLWSP